MSTLDWVLCGLVFIAVAGALQGLRLVAATSLSGRRRAKDRLLRDSSELGDDAAAEGGILLDGPRAGGSSRTPGAVRKRELELLLYRAGLRCSLSVFVTLMAVLGLAGFVTGLVLLRSTLIGAALTSIGALPVGYASLRKRARMKAFETQLPEALDLICRALRAGISLEFGLRSVGEELPDPIGSEFNLVADEISLGLDVRTALNNLATRINTNDMPFLVNAITIQRETGGNLAEILDNLSKIIRDRLKFYGKVKALVAQANLTANLLALMPVVFAGAMSLVSPDYMKPLLEPEGRIYLYGAGIMVPIGWFACKRMASVGI